MTGKDTAGAILAGAGAPSGRLQALRYQLQEPAPSYSNAICS